MAEDDAMEQLDLGDSIVGPEVEAAAHNEWHTCRGMARLSPPAHTMPKAYRLQNGVWPMMASGLYYEIWPPAYIIAYGLRPPAVCPMASGLCHGPAALRPLTRLCADRAVWHACYR